VIAVSERASDVLPLKDNRGFSRLWFGEGVSVLGTATSSVLLPLLAVVTFDTGAAWMGVLTAVTWLPWVLIGLPAGAWIDQWPARPVMIIADLLAAAAAGSVPVAWLLGVLSLPQLLVVALLIGFATVFLRTAHTTLVVAIVPARQLEEANSRLFGTESAMQTVGPGIGGLIAQALGAALGLVLDAASFVISAICLWRIRVPAEQSARAAEPTTSLFARIADGIRYLRDDRYLRWLVVIGSISNFGLVGYAALLVLYLVRDLGLGPSTVGLVMTVGSCGGLVGAVIAPRISSRLGSGRASTVLLLCGGPPALLLALAAPGIRVTLVVISLFVVGVCVVAGNVIRGAWRSSYVPPTLLGRVITASQTVNYGSAPVAALTAGWLGTALGIRETIAIMAAVHAAACFMILLSPFRPLRELPAPAPMPFSEPVSSE
jgi:MFS family permease